MASRRFDETRKKSGDPNALRDDGVQPAALQQKGYEEQTSPANITNGVRDIRTAGTGVSINEGLVTPPEIDDEDPQPRENSTLEPGDSGRRFILDDPDTFAAVWKHFDAQRERDREQATRSPGSHENRMSKELSEVEDEEDKSKPPRSDAVPSGLFHNSIEYTDQLGQAATEELTADSVTASQSTAPTR